MAWQFSFPKSAEGDGLSSGSVVVCLIENESEARRSAEALLMNGTVYPLLAEEVIDDTFLDGIKEGECQIVRIVK